MRLTFIVSSLWLSGGVHDLTGYALRLAARGHQVTIVVPRGAIDVSLVKRLEMRVEVVEAGDPVRPRMAYPAMARLSLALARAVPPGEAVIATHAPTALSALMASHRNKGQRRFWFYQDYLEMFNGRPVEQMFIRFLPRFFNHVMSLSASAAEEIRRHGARRVTNVRVGLSDEELFYPPADPAQRVPGLVLCLGDMRPRKGLFDFLAAADRLYAEEPQLRLAIVSKDECRIETRVPFDFYLRPPREQLAGLYRRCAVFVSPSWWESFGLPPLEAMACGAPVVLTESRGVDEYARPGENCLRVPPRDPPALAEAMRQVLHDRSLAKRLAQAGPPTAEEFNWETCVDRFEAALLNQD